MHHSFVVQGKPVPKERPRVGKGGRVFTPKRTLDYERIVAEAYDGPLFEGPIEVSIALTPDAAFVVLSSSTTTSKLRGDIDNYVKSILDGLQGVAFENDKSIVQLDVVKQA